MKKVAYRRISKLGKGSFGEVLLVERLSDKKVNLLTIILNEGSNPHVLQKSFLANSGL